MPASLSRRSRVVPTTDAQKALVVASAHRSFPALVEARAQWHKEEELPVLVWAVEHLSPWAVKHLLSLGEPVTPMVVTVLLNTLDYALAAQSARARAPVEKELIKNWRLLLPVVELSVELRRVTMECVFSRFRWDGVNAPCNLRWDALEMGRVLQKDMLEEIHEAPTATLDALEMICGADAGPRVLLSPLQLAWDQCRPDLCRHLVEQGVSVRASYWGSFWPTWTLEKAVEQPEAWLAELSGPERERASGAVAGQKKSMEEDDWARLQRTVRQRVMALELPLPADRSRGPRF